MRSSAKHRQALHVAPCVLRRGKEKVSRDSQASARRKRTLPHRHRFPHLRLAQQLTERLGLGPDVARLEEPQFAQSVRADDDNRGAAEARTGSATARRSALKINAPPEPPPRGQDCLASVAEARKVHVRRQDAARLARVVRRDLVHALEEDLRNPAAYRTVSSCRHGEKPGNTTRRTHQARGLSRPRRRRRSAGLQRGCPRCPSQARPRSCRR